MVDDYMLDKLLDKAEEMISIKKLDDTKILIESDDKLLCDITFQNVVILISCNIKDRDKFYLKLSLEALLALKLVET